VSAGTRLVLIPVLQAQRQYKGQTTSGRTSTYRVRPRGLGAASLSCDDDLVNRQDCAGGLGSELDGPKLGGEQVKNALLSGVQDAVVVVVL